jgi:hypothetical protein
MKTILIFIAVIVGLFLAAPVIVHLLVAIRGGLLGVGLCVGVILLINLLRRE